jgi:hypothetical protein
MAVNVTIQTQNCLARTVLEIDLLDGTKTMHIAPLSLNHHLHRVFRNRPPVGCMLTYVFRLRCTHYAIQEYVDFLDGYGRLGDHSESFMRVWKEHQDAERQERPATIDDKPWRAGFFH